jgi:hypothetical protein
VLRPLNKTELARQEHDNSMVQVFLHREDLMERILAYKMLRGRVESFLTMKAKIDLNSCAAMQEYEVAISAHAHFLNLNRQIELMKIARCLECEVPNPTF